MTVGRKILVVEDNALILDTLLLIFRRHGYHALGVDHGMRAIDEAQRFRPDVMLCDINLPGIDGVEVAIRSRDVVPGCRIVLLSGDSCASEKLEAAASQGYHFEVVAKPVDPGELLTRIAGRGLRGRAS